MAKIRILVCSDLHAYDGRGAGSEIPSSMDISQPTNNPIKALDVFLEKEGVPFDVLVCPGDLGHKALPIATIWAWESIVGLAKTNDATILATAGNHDLDSRVEYNEYDPKGMIQGLSPKFPVEEESLFHKYWSQHFCICIEKGVRFVLLNSCAFHGIGDEKDHGRLSKYTLEQMKKDVPENSFKINILVLHHPPHNQSESGQGDGDGLKLGDDLIQWLDAREDDWLIIYGHKHFANLSYARGSAQPSVLLSAGSVTATPPHEYAPNGKNQVHVITIDEAEIANHGFVGRVDSYDWYSGCDWSTADDKGGLPALCGFGYRGRNKDLVTRIDSLFLTTDSVLIADLELKVPEINWLDPIARQKLILSLEEKSITYSPPRKSFIKIPS